MRRCWAWGDVSTADETVVDGKVDGVGSAEEVGLFEHLLPPERRPLRVRFRQRGSGSGRISRKANVSSFPSNVPPQAMERKGENSNEQPQNAPLLVIYIAKYTINQGVGPTHLFPLSSVPPPPSSVSTPSTSPLPSKCSTSLSSSPTPCTTTSQTYTSSLPSSSGRAPSAAWSTSEHSPRSPRSRRVTSGSSR